MITGANFIEQFIEHYAANYPDYESLARQLGHDCEELRKQEGIKAVVTWRAKDKDRLQEKLYRRASERPNGYASPEETKLDIVGLCGARISLYYPVDRRRASDLVKEKFQTYMGKTHPEEGAQAAGGEYHGYNQRAVREHPRLGWVRVEIQVMTLLMNAWSEISHDDLYQGREGPLSPEEEAILQQINRLVIHHDPRPAFQPHEVELLP